MEAVSLVAVVLYSTKPRKSVYIYFKKEPQMSTYQTLLNFRPCLQTLASMFTSRSTDESCSGDRSGKCPAKRTFRESCYQWRVKAEKRLCTVLGLLYYTLVKQQ